MPVSLNGTNGLTFNDGSSQRTAATGFGFKNRIINGDMRVFQRGSSGTINAGTLGYTADRFYIYTLGSNVSYIQATGLVVGNNNSASAILMTGAANNTALNFGQRIESLNTRDLAGRQVTVSGWLFSSVSVTPVLYGFTPNSADNHGAVTSVGTLPALPTLQANTWTYFAVTFTLPNAAANGLDLGIQWGPTAAGVNRYATELQLEKGSTATSFDYRPYGTELQLCQRYYEITHVSFSGFGNGGSNLITSIPFKTTKRASPTVAFGADVGAWTTNFPTPTASVYSADEVSVNTGTAPSSALSRYNATVTLAAEL